MKKCYALFIAIFALNAAAEALRAWQLAGNPEASREMIIAAGLVLANTLLAIGCFVKMKKMEER